MKVLALVSVTALALLAGCSTSRQTAAAPLLELPAAAAPAESLKPLAFMAGRWIAVNPNKSVNQEHWTAPRGNHMSALFTQVRRDGKPGFFEISLITVEPDGSIVLKLRHLHGGLEVPEKRKDLSVFKLVSAANNRAEFAGTGAAEDVQSVVYRLTAEGQLAAEIGFAPTSKEKNFTTLYTRE